MPQAAHAEWRAHARDVILSAMLPQNSLASVPDSKFRSLWILTLGAASDVSDTDLAALIDKASPGCSAAGAIEHLPDAYQRLWKKMFGVPADFDAQKLLDMIDQFLVQTGQTTSQPICNSANANRALSR